MSVPPGIKTRTFNLTVFLTRAPDVEGQWVGHCLDVDVVSQGNSMRHAYEMAKEATEMVILDDLNAGREPTVRSAPPEEWEAAFKVVRSGSPSLYTLTELFNAEHRLHHAMAPLVLGFHAVEAAHSSSLQELEERPMAQAA